MSHRQRQMLHAIAYTFTEPCHGLRLGQVSFAKKGASAVVFAVSAIRYCSRAGDGFAFLLQKPVLAPQLHPTTTTFTKPMRELLNR